MIAPVFWNQVECSSWARTQPERAEDFADEEDATQRGALPSGVVNQAEVGVPVVAFIWKVGISE